MSRPPSNLTISTDRRLRELLGDNPDQRSLEAALKHLAAWRRTLIANTITSRDGNKVQNGPFSGMIYRGSLPARLLGAYELSLHPVVEEIINTPYEQILNVGCATGYYAVGLARRMHATKVYAFDIDANARKACAHMADINDVSERVVIKELCSHETFAMCRDARTLVVCDIEGAEYELLDPDRAPQLREVDILVEVHLNQHKDLVDVLKQRFSPTHEISDFGRALSADVFPEWMDELTDLDRLIALWEGRVLPTPWLWMKARHD